VNINKYICTGRLTKDPELRALPNGTSVCELRVAVDGRLEFGEWDSKDGKRHDYTVVGNVEFLAAPRAGEEPAGVTAEEPVAV
jgi:single-stranded DNA-binding protein